MDSYGFVKSFISQFLQNRPIICSFQGSASKQILVNSGVPQGCLLSPFLYNVYINDLHNFLNEFCILYADDTTIVLEASTDLLLMEKMNRCMRLLTEYFSM